MAVTGIGNAHGSIQEGVYALSARETIKAEEAKETVKKEAAKKTGNVNKQAEASGKGGNVEYLKALQKQVPYVKLETGFALSMKKDNRAGVITVNPGLLEKMQKDPEAAKRYTQTLKDIERAEKTGDAYYNALGGVVEMTSHWYVDENGNFSHFAYVRRDDKLNEKIRKETQEKAEELIEKTREKAVETRKEQRKAAAKRVEEKKAESKKTEEKNPASYYGENIIVEFSKDGMEALSQEKENNAKGFQKAD